jgi:hypothetical protein
VEHYDNSDAQKKSATTDNSGLHEPVGPQFPRHEGAHHIEGVQRANGERYVAEQRRKELRVKKLAA